MKKLVAPKYFQTQVVDNFFDKPKEIVKFANSLEYQIGQYGFWPGKRTEELHINHKKFFNSFLTKMLALFFDYKYAKISWDNVGLYFQKTSAFDPKDKNNILSFTLSVDSCNLKSFLDLIGVDMLCNAAFTSFDS